MKLIFEKSLEGKRACKLPGCDVPHAGLDKLIPENMARNKDYALPKISEPELVRHFTALSKRNHGVDSGFYPLGSCTMKYNPKINEDLSKMKGFSGAHPLADETHVQGCLEILYMMDKMLSEITGMEHFSLQPSAGAHGELAGLMIMRAYHEKRKDMGRKKVIIPDSAHGTNPASAAMVGYDVLEVKSDRRGNVDINALKELISGEVAGLMLTNPNTLGLFEEKIMEISKIVHDAGGLLYYDGANANAIMGVVRPGDMGFDIVHLNLHKTFSTPHGGGGPGSGPVGVKKHLARFLPSPAVSKKDDEYYFEYNMPDSIGRMKSFYGNFGVILKAYAYILTMGGKGLKEVSETSVLNANYLMEKLKDHFKLPYGRICKHEFVLSGIKQKEKGVTTLAMAKRIMDFGYHPPTIYFPLIVKEAIMVEPTETESLEALDNFADAMINIAKEAIQEPDKVKNAPYNTAVKRLDEITAARRPVLKWSQDR